jgi:hypothetical protein
MADETLTPAPAVAPVAAPPVIPIIEPAVPPTPEEVAAKKEADEAAKEQKAAEDKAAKEKKEADDKKKADLAKAKSAHIVPFVGGVPKNGIHAAVGNDGVKIVREGPLTIALITTCNPGQSAGCIARLPEKSELGDMVEVYTVPEEGSAWSQGAGVFPPKGESINSLPVSTGDNTGTGVSVDAGDGKAFRKVSPTNWQVS